MRTDIESIHLGAEAEAIYAEALKAERALHESLRFDIPEKLVPSTAMGLAMTAHFAGTPPEEFV